MPESSPFSIWLTRPTVHCLGDLALGQAARLAQVSEPVCTNLGDEPGRAALDVLTTDRLDVLVADVRPAQVAHVRLLFGGPLTSR
ncbi:MAG TPA: hypothetical protein VF003_15020 [Pseudonocardiaceae bacterium]